MMRLAIQRAQAKAMIVVLALCGVLGAASGAVAQGVEVTGGSHPMSYLHAFGSPGNELTGIVWGLTWLSTGVVVIIAALLAAGIVLRRRRAGDGRADRWELSRTSEGKALGWIYAAVVATIAILAFFTAWTVSTLAAISAPGEKPAVTVEVIGHEWWWEFIYRNEDGTEAFATANEMHVPVGRPVKLVLRSADVIHSFWVPKIAGKTDMIPGQTNLAWLRADEPGIYRGQCLEYCGLQHANMGLLLIAEKPEAFDAWWNRQSLPAGVPARDVAASPVDAGVASPEAIGPAVSGTTGRSTQTDEGGSPSE